MSGTFLCPLTSSCTSSADTFLCNHEQDQCKAPLRLELTDCCRGAEKICDPVNRAAYHEVVRRYVLAGARHVGNHRLRGGVPSKGWRAAGAGAYAYDAAAVGAVPARAGERNGEKKTPRDQGGCTAKGTSGARRQEGAGRSHSGNGEARWRGDKSYPVDSVEMVEYGTGISLAAELPRRRMPFASGFCVKPALSFVEIFEKVKKIFFVTLTFVIV